MASFPVSNNFGAFLRTLGFEVIPNTEKKRSGSLWDRKREPRPLRVVIPSDLTGKAAKAFWQSIFWQTHRSVRSDCPCCPPHIVPTFPREDKR